jgi:hypothetical protein
MRFVPAGYGEAAGTRSSSTCLRPRRAEPTGIPGTSPPHRRAAAGAMDDEQVASPATSDQADSDDARIARPDGVARHQRHAEVSSHPFTDCLRAPQLHGRHERDPESREVPLGDSSRARALLAHNVRFPGEGPGLHRPPPCEVRPAASLRERRSSPVLSGVPRCPPCDEYSASRPADGHLCTSTGSKTNLRPSSGLGAAA